MTPSTLTEDADILICECCFHQKPVPFHLNYPGIKKYWDAFGAKRVILTHMSPEMLAMADEVP